MIPVSRDRVPSLQSTDPATFRRFLAGGLSGFFGTPLRRHAFGEAAAYIGRDDSLPDSLLDIHDCLEDLEQLAFKAGVVDAMAMATQLPPRSVYGPFLTLVQLAGKVRALDFLERGPNLVHAVLPGLDEPRRIRLMTEAFEAVLLASPPDKKYRNTLIDLVCPRGLMRLPLRLSYPALVTLAAADPSLFKESLDHLWPWLDKAFGWADPDGADADAEEARRQRFRERLVIETFSKVPPAEFMRALAIESRIRPERYGGAAEWALSSDWWSRTLYSDHPEIEAIRTACSDTPYGAASEATGAAAPEPARPGDHDPLPDPEDDVSLQPNERAYYYKQHTYKQRTVAA